MVSFYLFMGFLFFMVSGFIFSESFKKSKMFAQKTAQFNELKSDEKAIAVFAIAFVLCLSVPAYFFVSMYMWPVLVGLYIVFRKQIQDFLCQV